MILRARWERSISYNKATNQIDVKSSKMKCGKVVFYLKMFKFASYSGKNEKN